MCDELKVETIDINSHTTGNVLSVAVTKMHLNDAYFLHIAAYHKGHYL